MSHDSNSKVHVLIVVITLQIDMGFTVHSNNEWKMNDLSKFKGSSIWFFCNWPFLDRTGQLHLAWGATEDPGSANGATDVHSQRAPHRIGYLSSNFKVWTMNIVSICAKLNSFNCYFIFCRYKNYMVALMNKNLIQTTVHLPLAGETNFFSKSLRFNLELIFFRTFQYKFSDTIEC